MGFGIINSSQSAISRNMRSLELTANNLANSNSPGFKKIKASFEKDNDEIVMNSYRINTSGAIEKDGNPLHIAILGEGFFQVQDQSGTYLRRSGDFALSAEGELITASGERVLVGGDELILEAIPEITGDGTIIVNGEMVGQIDIVIPEDINALQPARNGNFIYNGILEEPPETRLIQGALEGSNTSAVEEMNSLIELTRAAEIASKIFKTSSDMLRVASTELSKVD